MAAFWVVGNVRLLLGGMLIIVATYVVVLSGFVTFMRYEYGAGGSGSVAQLSTGYQAYSVAGRDELAYALPGVQSWWTRLSYANAQAFAMDGYDQASPGDSMWLAIDSIIPRFLYPNKPDITVGDYFNQLVTGSANSKSAPGIFAEAYWCGGWPLAIFGAAYVGLFFGFFTQYSYTRMVTGRFLYMGVAWLGITAALQPDSWYAATFVGPVATGLVIHLIIFLFLESTLTRLKGVTRPKSVRQ